MWQDLNGWRRRYWNNAFVAEYRANEDGGGFLYRVIEDPTETLLLEGFASSITPERLERVLEGDLRNLAARDTRELPQVG